MLLREFWCVDGFLLFSLYSFDQFLITSRSAHATTIIILVMQISFIYDKLYESFFVII